MTNDELPMTNEKQFYYSKLKTQNSKLKTVFSEGVTDESHCGTE
jgi:hypothetical protein